MKELLQQLDKIDAGFIFFALGVAGIMLTTILMALHDKLRQFFHTDEGQYSMTRFLMFFVTSSYVYYCGYIVYHDKKVQMFDWVGVVFLAWLYSANKGTFQGTIESLSNFVCSVKGIGRKK